MIWSCTFTCYSWKLYHEINLTLDVPHTDAKVLIVTLEWHDVRATVSQNTSISIVCSMACSDQQRGSIEAPHSWLLLRGIQLWPMDSLHKGQWCGKYIMTSPFSRDPTLPCLTYRFWKVNIGAYRSGVHWVRTTIVIFHWRFRLRRIPLHYIS